jgi:hypothetical protein
MGFGFVSHDCSPFNQMSSVWNTLGASFKSVSDRFESVHGLRHSVATSLLFNKTVTTSLPDLRVWLMTSGLHFLIRYAHGLSNITSRLLAFGKPP